MPQGKFIYGESLSLGIWKFSKNKELAKEFLRFHFEKQRFNRFLDVAKILMAEALSKGAIVSLCIMKPQDYNDEESPHP